jgi:RimJ/RimL family protein N-acetyltransferase
MINKDNIKIIRERFELVPFSINFVTDNYINWLRNENINKYLVKPDEKITKDSVLEYCNNLINSKNDIFLAIITRPEGKHIGNVRLGPIYILSKVCKFSIMIGDESYHSKGYGTEIVRACIEYVFNNLQMQKFYLDVVSDNEAAVRMYEKNKMHQEGYLKNHIFLKNKFYDLKIMSIFNSANDR